MSAAAQGSRSHVTLALTTLLHGFTHAYGTLLVPLYLLMVADLHLSGVWQASLIVTIYGLVYCIGSYIAGVLADRLDRRRLLAVGLFGNAVAILMMGLTRSYEMMIALGVMAGVFGTIFHPTANALVPAHYPRSPGMAIGILGMGSGIGFFTGPQYAGWRAETATWQFAHVANWQKPCVEMGIAGIVFSAVFLLLATETRRRSNGNASDSTSDPQTAMLPNRMSVEAIVTEYRAVNDHLPRTLVPALKRRVIAIAAILGWRDFAGVASMTLVSIYLQKAYHYDARHAGLVVGGMMLASILINPFAVYMSPGSRRLRTLTTVLILGGISFASVPWLAQRWILPMLCVFQSFQLGSYAVSDAAMLERVDPAVRGRVVGLFLTLAGTLAGTAPLVIGLWVDLLGTRNQQPDAYIPLFAAMGGLMCVAAFSSRLFVKLGEPQLPDAVATSPVMA